MLTEDQRKKMEENRKKALEKRAARLNQSVTTQVPSVNNEHMPEPNNVYPTINPSCRSPSKPNLAGVYPTFNPSCRSPSKPELSGLYPTFNPSCRSPSKPVFAGNSTIASVPQCTGLKPSATVVCKNPSKASTSTSITGTFVLISRQRFRVDVGYHKEMIEIFKTIPSRMYNATEKKWTFSIKDHNALVKALKPLQPTVMLSPLTKTVVDIFSKAPENVTISETDLSTLDPTLQEALLPFQKEGVYYSLARQGRVLIADDMGLGKTIQAIAVSSYYIKEWPLLIVVPSSVKFTWAQAFYTWMPSLPRSEVNVLSTVKDSVFEGNVVIASYDLLSRKSNDFTKRGFKVAIMDESHFLKNPKSARTKAAQQATKKCTRLILLSGTPALSRPVELYTQICMIRRNLFKVFQEFGTRYCSGKVMPWGWDYSGSSNMQELQLILEETILIRRLKSDVITQLPAKRRQVILLDPSHIKGNKKKLNTFSREMNNEKLKQMEKRGVLLRFFQETGAAKIPAIADYIGDLLEANHKFLCFAHHQIVMNEICQTVESKGVKYIRIDGATASDKRKVLCDKFQLDDSYRVAVLSITAASTGISLTAAHLVLFAELFWNPGILTQAEDRAHRIGQQDSVIIQYLVAQGTADDFVWPLVQKKLDVLCKAGLSKDNFRNADTCTIKMTDSTQNTLDSFFESISNEEFWEDLTCEDLKSIDEEPLEKRGKF